MRECLCVCTVDLSLFKTFILFYVLYILCMDQAVWNKRDDDDDDDDEDAESNVQLHCIVGLL